MSEEKQPLNLYQRMAEIMKSIEYLQKDDNIAFKAVKYKAISEEKVTTAVRKELINNGIVIIPIAQEHTKVNDLTTVNVTYRIQNIDNPEDYITAVSSGTGVDLQDKGVGKAMTYAYKYLLLRTFAIPTGEDPDKTSNEELDEQKRQEQEDRYNLIMDIAHKAGFPEEKVISQVQSRYKKHPSKLNQNEYEEVLKGYTALAKDQ